MGKNLTIYFNDRAIELIEGVEGKGTLLNELVINHFDNDEEILKVQIESLEKDLARLRAKLQDKIEERVKISKLKTENSKERMAREERKNISEKLAQIWKEEKITDEQYWACFDGNELLEEKAKEIISNDK